MRAVSAGARGYPSICVPSTPASTMFARSWPEPSRLQSPEFALQRIVNGTPSRYAADTPTPLPRQLVRSVHAGHVPHVEPRRPVEIRLAQLQPARTIDDERLIR